VVAATHVDIPIEDTGMLEESLPPAARQVAPNEDEMIESSSAFSFPALNIPVLPVAETGKTVGPGDADFQKAVQALPPGLKEKLRETLGAEFTVLRPIPVGKLRRPQ
jgi:hypothetical protein